MKYFGVIKIVIKLLVLYKNIFFIVVVNMNKRNFVIVIFVYLMYFMDRGIYRVEYSKIRNWKILLKLFVWKFFEKLIIGFFFYWNNRVVMFIIKFVEEMKYN